MLLFRNSRSASSENLYEDHGYTYHWTSGQKPHLTKNGKRIDCNFSNYLPLVVPVVSATSSTTPSSASSPSSSQESTFDERTFEGCGRDLMQRNADTSSSPHDPPMEPRAKVEPGSGEHSVFTHFPKDPNCEICLKTKITRASCRRRAGTVVPRAEHFGDMIAADHKVLSEECESRNNHRYAVVVPDLATQWLQSYPNKTKSSQETQKSLMKFLEPNRKPKSHLH